MFDDGPVSAVRPPIHPRSADRRPIDRDELRRLAEQVRPLAASGERTLPVPEAFADLIPQGGLVRGSLVASTGGAATSVALPPWDESHEG